jgi:hypothetical protein
MRAILQCDPVGPCMGYEGDCGDYQTQFAGVQGSYIFSDGPGEPPVEHEYIDDYVCHAFPDDAYVTDQFFVGLISVAVALPIDLFLARAFEIANEGEVPKNWVDVPPGKWKLLLGKDMHNGWHLADRAHPVSDFVLWLIGEQAEDFVTSLLMLPMWLLGRLRGRGAAAKPQWGAKQDEDGDEAARAVGEQHDDEAQSSGGGSSHASGDARADALRKRLYASAGLIGVYLCWTIFSWCVSHAALRQMGHSNGACSQGGMHALPFCSLAACICSHVARAPPACLGCTGSSSRMACSSTSSWAPTRRTSLPKPGASATR